MTRTCMAAVWAAGVAATAWAADPLGTEGNLAARKPGDSFVLGGTPVAVKVVEVLPLVNNEFSKRFVFDAFADENLKKLRRQEKLDEVVKDANSEFERMVLLMDWAFKRVKRFGQPQARYTSGLEVLKAIDANLPMNCTYYAILLRDALRSMGFVVRGLGLKGAASDGNGSEHGVVEAWSNQHRKWVMLDPTVSAYLTKGGVPLNGYEIRREWFYHEGGKDLRIVVGAEAKTYTVKEMPIARGRPGHSTLTLNANSIGKFLYLAYTPTTADGGPDYGKMFITKDQLCEGVSYHTRDNPKDPAVDPYWPMQQAALTLTAGSGTSIAVQAETNTPDFAAFRHRLDGGAWKDGVPATWTLQPGDNTLEVRSVNKFGLAGAISKVVLNLASD